MSNKNDGLEPRGRDREDTERRIIAAAVDIIRNDGFDRVGVSSVARRAGVSKILIYRYFGDFDGLLERVGGEIDPASIRGISDGVEEGLRNRLELADILKQTVLDLRRRLGSDDLSMNLMAWEMMYENDVTRAFARTREEAGLELNRRLRTLIGSGTDVDVEATFAVFSAAIYYLLLRARHVSDYGGLDIRSDAGWERLADAMAAMLRGVMD